MVFSSSGVGRTLGSTERRNPMTCILKFEWPTNAATLGPSGNASRWKEVFRKCIPVFHALHNGQHVLPWNRLNPTKNVCDVLWFTDCGTQGTAAHDNGGGRRAAPIQRGWDPLQSRHHNRYENR